MARRGGRGAWGRERRAVGARRGGRGAWGRGEVIGRGEASRLAPLAPHLVKGRGRQLPERRREHGQLFIEACNEVLIACILICICILAIITVFEKASRTDGRTDEVLALVLLSTY